MPEAALNSAATRAGERHQLYKTAVVATGVLAAYTIYTGWHLPGELLALSMLSISLAVWPALRWLRRQPYQFPAFEAFMLTCIPSYALQLASDHEALGIYSDAVIAKAMLAVIVFQLSALLAFSRTIAFEKRTPFWTDEMFTRDISRWLPNGLWLNAGYIWVSHYTTWLPADIDSILRSIFFGIATSCSFLLGRRWGAGELRQGVKTNVFLALAVTAILQVSSLYLINSIASALVFFLAYISSGKRIPVTALGLVFILLTILHNGKAPMREKYWALGAPKVTIAQLPSFYTEWFEHGLSPFRDEEQSGNRRELLERASLLHIICLTVESTDRGLPFMGGETYTYVLPMLVPRFFWPEKPSGQITTRRLGIHFGLQDEESTRTTSIGFGVLAEAYANFGYWGVILLGLLIGWANKVIAIWTRSAPLLSNGGFIMILLMAWSIQVELPMSGWVSSLFQASICVLGIPYVIKRLFR
jgi:hypothetical protein